MTQPDIPSDITTGLRVLFVCSGNTCRSPLAEALARRVVEGLGMSEVDVRSAGISTAAGLPASEGARKAALRHGLSLEDHESAPISSELVAWAHVVLAMGPHHLRRVRELGGGPKGSLLGAFAEEKDGDGTVGTDFAVPDPFGGDDRIYEDTFQTLEHWVDLALKRLRKEVRR